MNEQVVEFINENNDALFNQKKVDVLKLIAANYIYKELPPFVKFTRSGDKLERTPGTFVYIDYKEEINCYPAYKKYEFTFDITEEELDAIIKSLPKKDFDIDDNAKIKKDVHTIRNISMFYFVTTLIGVSVYLLILFILSIK